jgi:zinc transport system ATP-binding protein
MSTTVLSVRDLVVRLGDHRVLDGITFEATGGDFVAIIGPNGAGKTTLLKAVLGLVEPYAGSVRVFGALPHAAPAEHVGYVPQVKTLDRSFPATARDLVLTGLQQRWPFGTTAEERDAAEAALARVDAADLADAALGTLSGGELQRVYLARSLIRSPRLLVLDEPATGVDAAGATDLYDLLEAYQVEHQATVLMVTHDWNAAYHHATRALLLDGQQISFGPPRDALDERCLRKAFGHIGHAHAMLHTGSAHDDAPHD